MKQYYLYILLVISFLFTSPQYIFSGGKKDWSKPETIDPYKEDIISFLDTSINEFHQQVHKAFREGEYEKAAQYLLAILHHDRTDKYSLYNLASAYARLGKTELASSLLERAYWAGFDDLDFIKSDNNFHSIRNEEVFKNIITLIENEEKRKGVQLGELIWIDSTILLECRIRVPENFNPEKEYILVLGLHGHGGKPDNFLPVWEKFEKKNFIFASLRAPYIYHRGSYLGHSWVRWDENDESLYKKSVALSEKYVVHAIDKLKTAYNVTDTYLLGFSQGGKLTYSTGINYHHLFKGLICFGARLEIENIGKSALDDAQSHLRIFIAHGNGDRVVEPEFGEKAYDQLKYLGFDVIFHEFSGGHRLDENALQAAEDWIFDNY